MTTNTIGNLPSVLAAHISIFLEGQDVAKCSTLSKASLQNTAPLKSRVKQLNPAMYNHFCLFEEQGIKVEWVELFQSVASANKIAKDQDALLQRIAAAKTVQDNISLRVAQDEDFSFAANKVIVKSVAVFTLGWNVAKLLSNQTSTQDPAQSVDRGNIDENDVRSHW